MHTPDWSAGMEKWRSLVTPQMPVQANELMVRMFEMGQIYTRLAEAGVAAESASKNKSDKNDKSALDGWMAAMESILPGSELSCQQMQNLPGLAGFTGNTSQDSQNKLTDLATAYQKAMQGYMAAFSGQGVESMRALRERLAQMTREGVTITSLRELYNLWVDISEEVYYKFAMSDHYQQVYGEMVNAFVALKGGIDTAQPASADKPVTQPESAANPKKQEVKGDIKSDNLMCIKGIGPKLQKRLMDAGIQTFDQLAVLSEYQVQALDKQLDARGRLVRENWVDQASDMSGNKLV